MKPWILVLFLVFSCSERKVSYYKKVINNPVKIFMHERGSYSIMCKDSLGVLKMKKVSSRVDFYEDNVRFYIVNNTKEERVEVIHKNSRCDGRFPVSIKFYLTDINKINGAGWDHGKHGSGQTVIIK